MRERYKADPIKAINAVKKSQRKLKVEVLTHYSTKPYPICADPFHKHLPNDPMLTDIRVLSIDHINDNGAEERRRIFGTNGGYGGHVFYCWLKKHNFPEGHQDLCMNCQYIKRDEFNLNKRTALNGARCTMLPVPTKPRRKTKAKKQPDPEPEPVEEKAEEEPVEEEATEVIED